MELDRTFTERCQIVVGRPDLNDDIAIIGIGNFPDIEIDKLPTNRKGGEPGWRGKCEGTARLSARAKVVGNRKGPASLVFSSAVNRARAAAIASASTPALLTTSISVWSTNCWGGRQRGGRILKDELELGLQS